MHATVHARARARTHTHTHVEQLKCNDWRRYKRETLSICLLTKASRISACTTWYAQVRALYNSEGYDAPLKRMALPLLVGPDALEGTLAGVPLIVLDKILSARVSAWKRWGPRRWELLAFR